MLQLAPESFEPKIAEDVQSIPLVERPTIAGKSELIAMSPMCQVTVLVVDDQIMIGEAIRRTLAHQEDIAFHFCNDPAEAIQQAVKIQPTVILQDLVMPHVDGLMLLRWFRSHPATREIPIVVLSATEEPKLKAEAFAQGANDYLIKLPDEVELIARIRYHSKAYNSLKALSAATATAQQQTHQLEQTLQKLQKTQSQLIQTEKMSSLGQLVAGVAHEINNPVNFIYGNLAHVDSYTQSLLRLLKLYQERHPTTDPEIQNVIEDIDLDFLIEDLPKILASMAVGSDRIREIVLTLRNFSRLDEAEMKPVDIHEGIDSTLLILRNRLKAHTTQPGIQIIKEYGELPQVECYAGQLNQVFMNILSNAIDVLHTYDNQRSPEDLFSHPSTITIRTQELDSERVAICIKDNGPGIDACTQTRLFDPFFTTKPIGQGTGLGLAISHQIVVEKHAGVIRCVSEPGQGAEFWIEIPRYTASKR